MRITTLAEYGVICALHLARRAAEGPITGREIAELERRMRVNDRVLRYITVRVDEDRRRAEKLKARRARKVAKRPERHGGPSRRGPAMEFAEASGE